MCKVFSTLRHTIVNRILSPPSDPGHYFVLIAFSVNYMQHEEEKKKRLECVCITKQSQDE